MDLSSHEGGGHEIPAIPISSSYAGGGGHAHLIHHHHHHHPSSDVPPPLPPPTLPLPHNHSIIIPCSAVAAAPPHSNGPILSSTTTIHNHEEEVEEEEEEEDHIPYKKQQQTVRYRECLKNHAAAMGGNATDGCGEFMPSGEEGSLEALKCSACNCHRNFHRKEIEGDHHQVSSFDFYHHHPHLNKIGMGRKVIVAAGHHHNHNHKVLGSEALGYPTATGTLIPSSRPAQPPHQHHHQYHHPSQMIMSYNLGGSIPSESDEQEGGGGGGVHHHEGILAGARGTLAAHHHHHHHQMVLKKRFRTKFTPEQKEKMLGFAEKVGWRIQKQEEGVVQQFCQEIGVKRRVLKVWMHNNKHNLSKKNSNHSSTT